MSLTGGYVDAEQALAWGLVNEVVAGDALLDRAQALAREIAETDLETMRKVRGLIGDSDAATYGSGLAREIEVFEGHIGSLTTEGVATSRDKVQARGRRVTRDGG